MNLIVNGKANNGYYRIDNLDENRVGGDFLKYPFAIVRTEEDAEYICKVINRFECEMQELETKEEGSLSEYWNTKGLQ